MHPEPEEARIAHGIANYHELTVIPILTLKGNIIPIVHPVLRYSTISKSVSHVSIYA